VKRRPPAPFHPRPAAGGPPPRDKLGEDRLGLDSTWDRKLARGALVPDFTLDLHGHTLASAHSRLDHGLTQAKALGARTVLLITGKSRPAEAADRGERRGAIRAKVLDWLAAGPHASSIAAIRTAHRRHGGEGALYLILRKPR
jgi:DNA-nicking Smr family endonuclease